MGRRRKNELIVEGKPGGTSIPSTLLEYKVDVLFRDFGDYLKNFEDIVQKLSKIYEILTREPEKTLEKTPVPRILDEKVGLMPLNTVTQQEFVTPVPLDYRMLADNTLNKSFEVRVNPLSDDPAFDLIISVPKKYSNAPAGHWEMYKADERHKVISYADGMNGVRQFCEQVFNNFSTETKTTIIQDRLNAQ